MVDVRRAPFNEIPERWAFDPEIGPFIQELLSQIEELRLRTGGDSDTVQSVESISATNFYAGAMFPERINDTFSHVDQPTVHYNPFQYVEDDEVRGQESPLGINSTNTPLSGAATFTGTADKNDWPDVGVSCYADVAGTLYLDFSVDGANWNTFPTNGFVVDAGIHEFHTAVKLGRYFRVRYINGSSAQSEFRLYTYFGRFRNPNLPLNQAHSLDADAYLVRSSWPWLDQARGLNTGITTIQKFGRNTAVGSTYAVVALSGVYPTPQPSAATTVRIAAGGDANDTAAGTGAREVTVVGLDENFELATEAIATAGAGASSATTTTFTRIYRAYVSVSGTYASTASFSHAGTITVENSGGGTTWAVIDATDIPKGQTEIGAFTVPAGSTGHVRLLNVSVDSGKAVDIAFFQRSNCDQAAAPYSAARVQSVLIGLSGGNVQTLGEKLIPFGPYAGPTDLGFMAKKNGASSDASVSVEFEVFMVAE